MTVHTPEIVEPEPNVRRGKGRRTGKGKTQEAQPVEPVTDEKPGPTKHVRRTTVEEFEEQMQRQADEQQADEEDEAGEDDFEDDQGEVDDEPEPIELSPLEKFGQSVGQSSDYYLYVVRLPDPPHARGIFRLPCVEETIFGSIPFDADTFISDVQTLSGSGGKYRLQVRRRNGSVAKQVTVIIADPPEQNARQNIGQGQQQPQGESSFLSPSFTTQLTEFAKIAETLGLGPRRGAVPAAATLPPSSPVDEIKRAKTLIDTIKSVSEAISPPPPPAPPASNGGVFGGLASLAHELGVKDFFSQVLPGLVMQYQRAMLHPAAMTTPAPALDGQPQATGAQAVGPSPLPPAVASALELVCLEARRNAPTGKAADAIVSLACAEPQLGAMLHEVLAMPPHQIVETVAQLSGHTYLVDLPHSIEWFALLNQDVGERVAEIKRQGKQSDEAEMDEAEMGVNEQTTPGAGEGEGQE